jgi:hypothetical protein
MLVNFCLELAADFLHLKSGTKNRVRKGGRVAFFGPTLRKRKVNNFHTASYKLADKARRVRASEKQQIKLRACSMPHDAGVARDNSHFVACRNVRVGSVPFLGALTPPAR